MRAQAKKRTLRLSLLIGAAIVAVFVVVAVAGRFFLDSDDDDGPIVPTDGVVTTELAPAQDDPTTDDPTTDEPTTDEPTDSVADGEG